MTPDLNNPKVVSSNDISHITLHTDLLAREITIIYWNVFRIEVMTLSDLNRSIIVIIRLKTPKFL